MTWYKQVDCRKKQHTIGRNLLEHRIVMEKATGISLGFNDIVHHKDGNIRNNSLDNLEIVSRKEHPTIHAQERLKRCGKLCLADQCQKLTLAWHGLCHQHSTIQGIWARRRGEKTGWGIEHWLKYYTPRRVK